MTTEIPKTITAHGEVSDITTLAGTPSDHATLTGIITAFETDSSHGIRFMGADALTARQPLKRVKLLLEHDSTKPIGYMTALNLAAATAEFSIPPTPAGKSALAEVKAGLRTGLSVGCAIKNARLSDDGVLEINSAELYEVSLVAIPAFADAEVTSIAAALNPTRKEPAMENHTDKTTPVETTGPVLQDDGHAQAAMPATARPQPRTLNAVVHDVAAAVATGDVGHVKAALTDLLPSHDSGEGWIRDSWLGELWAAEPSGRPVIEALGAPKPLTTGSKVKGWRFTTKPAVADYAGNKTEIPSNAVATEPVEAPVHRSAGGWDIDRIYLDLGEPGFLESFWTAAVADYKLDSDAYALTQLKAGAGVTSLTATTLLPALSEIGATFAKRGANVDAIFIAPDLFESYAELKTSEVPFWLANTSGVGLKTGAATVADLAVKVLPALGAGEILAFDTRAAQYFEKTPPIRVNAVDLPRGGIDLALFGYNALLVTEPKAIVSATLTAGSAGTSS